MGRPKIAVTNPLKTFTHILLDAAKTFDKRACDINYAQWRYVANGRMSSHYIALFGYTNMRNAVAPKENVTKQAAKEARKMLEKLVSNV